MRVKIGWIVVAFMVAGGQSEPRTSRPSPSGLRRVRAWGRLAIITSLATALW